MKLQYSLVFVLIFVLFSCSKKESISTKSDNKSIISFRFDSFTPTIVATIDSSKKTITAVLPATTNLTKLIPTISVSNKATISPTSGQSVDFSKSVIYTVTAEDGSIQQYNVSIELLKPISYDCQDNFMSLNIKNEKLCTNFGEFGVSINSKYDFSDLINSKPNKLKFWLNFPTKSISYPEWTQIEFHGCILNLVKVGIYEFDNSEFKLNQFNEIDYGKNVSYIEIKKQGQNYNPETRNINIYKIVNGKMNITELTNDYITGDYYIKTENLINKTDTISISGNFKKLLIK